MKKLTPILILILVVGLVSVSGCISYVNPDSGLDNINLTDNSNQNTNTDDSTVKTVETFNKSGNITIGEEKDSKKIKENKKADKANVKFSKEEIEKQVLDLMKKNDPYLNYTVDTTLIEDNGVYYYIVDVYDDYGWFGFLEIDANEGIDEEGGCAGGAFRGETGDEPRPIEGVMPELSINDARKIMDKELESTNYSVDNPYYDIQGFLKEGKPYYNFTIQQYDESIEDTVIIGNATMDANTGEIIELNLVSEQGSNSAKNSNGQKIYSVDEAGDYVDIE